MPTKTEQLNKLLVEWEDGLPDCQGKIILEEILDEMSCNFNNPERKAENG
jgi:hypothetical protein